jgi:hypothetical protein
MGSVPITISIKKLQSNDLYEQLLFSYFADNESFIKTFAENGIIIQGLQDLDFLVEVSNSGADKNGALRDADGKRKVFDIVSILHSVKVRNDKLRESNIQFIIEPEQ